MKPQPLRAAALAAPLVAALVAACGSGNITFGGGGGGGNDNAKVTFTGNLKSVSPVTTRDIVVFVYNIDDDSDRCPCPPDPSNNPNGKAVVLSSGTTTFTVSDLDRDNGKFGVVFLLDNAGNAADGQIDPGDPIAILDDVDCELGDVSSRITVNLKDVDLLFSATPTDQCQDGTPPAEGRARADQITMKTTTTTLAGG